MPVSTRRMLLASLASGLAFFIIPFVGVIIGVSQMPFLNPDGTPDNAPLRGGAAFVLVSPILFAFVTLFAFCGGLLLQHLRRLNPRALLSVVVSLSVIAGLIVASQSRFGWNDALVGFLVFSALVFGASSLSAWVWWKVAFWRKRMRTRNSQAGRSARGA